MTLNLSPLRVDHDTHPLATSTTVGGVQQTLHLIKKALSEEDRHVGQPIQGTTYRGTF